MAEASAATPALSAPPSPAAGASSQLDELMLAMDVVDTLRHQDLLVSRELDETRRDAQLIERLRRIYHDQGIDVPDRVLQEGVNALKESRFVYTPPKPGLATNLATLWVARRRIGRGLLAALAAIVLGAGFYYVGVVRPEQQRVEQARAAAEQERIDLAERLPRALQEAYADAMAAAQVDEARQRADQLLADGRSALTKGDRPAVAQAIEQLETLRAELRREYTLRIVSRPRAQPADHERGGPGDPHGLTLGRSRERAGLQRGPRRQERRRHRPAKQGRREEVGRACNRLQPPRSRGQHTAVVT
jgi:hypothetical protein